MDAPARHAIVAGAGIGGLTAALALARAGLRVSVLERRPVIDEIGAGIQLPPNAMRVLDTLGIGETVRARATQTQNLQLRDMRSGRELMRLPQAAMQARWGKPGLVLHRADLQRLLLEAVALHPGIALQTGIAVAGFASGVDGVAVATRRGLIRQQMAGDLLVGADGLHSSVRAAVQTQGGDDLRFSGSFAWRALVAMDRLPQALHSRDTVLWLGPKLHLVHYALRRSTLMNVVAVVGGAPPGAAPPDEWNERGDPAAIAQAFARTAPEVRTLIAAAEDWRVWPLYDRLPKPWSTGRAVLIGDAAHPLLPFLAQGAAQAIEDAGALARSLLANGDTAAALIGFERASLPRVTEVARQSRQQGRIYHLAGAAALARNLVMRFSGEARLLKRLDWLYAGHD